MAFCDFSHFVRSVASGFDAVMAFARLDAPETHFCCFLGDVSCKNTPDVSQVAKRRNLLQQYVYARLE